MRGEKSENINSKSEGFNAGKPDEHFPEDKGAPDQPLQRSPYGQTSNIEPQTKEMEVHHHGLVHYQKKWREYLFQFFMLFLAVFCGFLAEYQLEHRIEKDREVQYMRSFVLDLQNDIIELDKGFSSKDQRQKAIDSVFIFFNVNPDVQKVPGSVIRQMRRTTYDRTYRRNTTTMDQLKNAGGLRLIRKRQVRDSIASYDLLWQKADFWLERYMLMLEKGQDYLHNIIDAKSAMSEYLKQRGSPITYSYSDSATTDILTNQLNQYLNFLYSQRISTARDKGAYEELQESAMRLVDLIKKEYRLK